MLKIRFDRIFLYFLEFLPFFAVICSQLFISCINNIPEEMPEASNIPISLSTSQKDILGFTVNEFEENDAIGLYIMIYPGSIENTRYIDNMKFSNDASTGFSPQEIIFFPEGNNVCNFVSYYPYQKDAIAKGKSYIKVETPTNQSEKAAFSASDFMIATIDEVATSKDPVPLVFSHKLFKLNILLEAKSGYTPETMLNANPTVKIKNVYTKANYDLNTNKFTDYSEKADIIPFGSWTIEGDMLCGKSAIIIPQTIAKSHIIIELYVENCLYECKLKEERLLPGGIAEDNTISLFSSDDATETFITTSINSWTSQQNSMEATQANTVVQTSQLDFTKSNVLKIMNKEKQVAEICLEYLCTDQLEKQATVIYPTSNGKTDLTKGLILELKGETENKHGGSVVWNKTNNSLTYTEGTSYPIDYIYLTESGEIKTSRPTNAIQLQLQPDILTDKRGEETIEYPIIKIGTQYWTRINFKPTKYTDGTAINYGGSTADNVVVNNTTPKYYERAKAYFFYNTACVTTGKLAPVGWRIGNETDYTSLKAYIKDNASVLKNNTAGTWGEGHDASNLAGFNAVATGYFDKTYINSTPHGAYWSPNPDSPNIIDRIVKLNKTDNKVTFDSATTDMALTIRCTRD